MNKYLKNLATISLVFVTVLLPAVTLAAEFRTGNTASLKSGESISGDVYIFGSTIQSDGKLTGDLTVAGGTVTINSNVPETLRVAGGNININGNVGRDILVAGGQININSQNISGDVYVVGGNVTINSHVSGNVDVRAGQVTLGNSAVIDGNLTYSSNQNLATSDNTIIRGTTTKKEFNLRPNIQNKRGLFAKIAAIGLVIKLLMLFVSALVLGLFFKKYSKTVTESAIKKPLRNLGIGFVIAVVLPVASIITLITVVGAPLGIIGLIAFGLIILVSVLLAVIFTGSLVVYWFNGSKGISITWATILLGAVVFTLLSLVPIVGWIAKVVLVIIAIGSAMRLKWGLAKEWR